MLEIRTNFQSSKIGNDDNDNEDAVFFDLTKNKFAISDGATTGMFSQKWANMLVKSFVNSEKGLFEDPSIFDEIITTAKDEWKNTIPWDTLAWNAKAKAEQGSFSTFLGLDLKPDVGFRWNAISVGDSCLFKIKSGQITGSFPLQTSSEFNYNPHLICSISDSYKSHVATISGMLEKDESLLLATDSVSKWIAQRHETNPTENILKVLPQDNAQMKEFFSKEIDAGNMKNDDLTLLVISH